MKRSERSLEEKIETRITTPPSAASRSMRTEFYSKWHKRRKTQSSASLNPFTVLDALQGPDISKFGSAAKDIEQLRARHRKIMQSCFGIGESPTDPAPPTGADIKKDQSKDHKHALIEQPDLENHSFIDFIDDQVTSKPYPIITLDFDGEENEDLRLSCSDKGDKDQSKEPNEQFASLSDQASNDVAEKVSPIIILDSDDEDNEDFRPSVDEGVKNPSNVVTDQVSGVSDQVDVIEKAPSIALLDPDAGKYGEFSPAAADGVSTTLEIVNDHVVQKASSTAIHDPYTEKYGEFSPATAVDGGSGTLERVNEHIIEKASSAATLDLDAEEYEEFSSSASDGGSGTLDMVIEQKVSHVLDRVVTGSRDEHITKAVADMSSPPTIFYSDDKSIQQLSSLPNQVFDVTKPTGELYKKYVLATDCIKDKSPSEEGGEVHVEKDKGVYIGVEEDVEMEANDGEDDHLDDIWKEMSFALECSKDIGEDLSSEEHVRGVAEDCDHCFILKDDLGYVCRVCGVIQRGIETIFEFVYSKGKKSTRTYMSESQNLKHKESNEIFSVGDKFSEDVKMVSEINADPRHMKEMKSHQLEGFKFLQSNLLSDTPGGCVLAHAPGSGKTFMIISFLQSFLAEFPNARPLIVLPKGILSTWKKEVQKWQVEDIPLHDFYTAKAENRSQQLDVLKLWVKEKSILFLGFKQFSSIICDSGSNKTTVECQEILLKVPTILILDEGHTSRNDETDVFQSLAKVQTPRKVVLSGTLYQNNVKEVFNILNLVRPRFLKSKASLDIRKRIMSRVQIGGVRKQVNSYSDSTFFELVECALQKDNNHSRKVSVITDLREMTHSILHYYKGDFLEELPGLVDFTVFLNLSRRQKAEVPYLQKLDKFKRISEGVAVYMHPNLKSSMGDKSSSFDDAKMDNILKEMELKDGVKMMFFLNLLRLCESAGEKLLVFSQFITPLKLLERFSVMAKGWSLRKQIFVLTGDTNSENRELSMDRFNNSPDAKVFFGSIKACGEGISLVGASRVLILDVHLNPSVTRQAIGRAFRPGQKNKVYIYRLVAADSPEEEDHWTSSRKELVSKMWFEWNTTCRQQDFEMKTVDVNECGDAFLEDSPLSEDIKVLYKR